MNQALITPVILTYNEEPNIETTLAALSWAKRIVVLDSGSVDRTESISRSFRNVQWFVREFDNHASQWRFAIHETAVDTEFVLALDADMRPSNGFEQEMQGFLRHNTYAGAWLAFDYYTLSRSLSGSIYPAQIRVFRKDQVRIGQAGHTQVFSIDGPLYRFQSKLIHDDRKSIERWLNNQFKYASLEAARIKAVAKVGLKDRLRLLGISPFAWGLFAYFRAGGPFNLRASRAYAHERIIFEAILSRLLAENQIAVMSPNSPPYDHTRA